MRRDAFQAIADPTRREILSLISIKAMTPNEISEHFESSRQAVSKHIKILNECKLVTQVYSGREIYYRINPVKIKEVDNWLKPFRLMWENKFENLDKILNKNK